MGTSTSHNRSGSSRPRLPILTALVTLALGAGIWAGHRSATRPSQPLAPPAAAERDGSAAPLQKPTHPVQVPAQPRPASDPGPQSPAEPIEQAALDYQAGRNNIYFRESELLKKLAANGIHNIQRMRASLHATRDVESLPPDTQVARDKPKAVLARMGMLDLLEGFITHDMGPGLRSAAREALSEVATSPLPRGLADQAKRILVAEKYDSLVALARHDQEAAFTAFSQIHDVRLKEILRPALLGGLLDSGVLPGDAEKLLAKL